jgi:hypothetical protein
MIVRIGVREAPKELEIEMADDTDAEVVKTQVESAMSAADGVLWLTDRDGRQVGIPAGRVAYVDLGVSGAGPRIGFGA